MYTASRREFCSLGVLADEDHTIARALTSRYKRYLTKDGKHAYCGPPKDKS